MTEHFEDFDAATLDRYLRSAGDDTTGFVVIPGIEVHLSGLDTIVFPVRTSNSQEWAEGAPTGRCSKCWHTLPGIGLKMSRTFRSLRSMASNCGISRPTASIFRLWSS